MMECLALAPLRFTIWSSDFGLIRTNLLVNAHPKTTVRRLLQYVHSQLAAELEASGNGGAEQLGGPGAYTFYYKSQELSLNIFLQDVEPMHGQGFIRLRFEKRNLFSGSAENLDYERETEFSSANLEIDVNALSVDKVMRTYEPNIPMGTTVARLKKLVLKGICEYENKNSKNLCGLKENHTVSDLAGFIIKGKQSPVNLNDESNSEYQDDLTLSELLGYDFVPDRSGHFTIMFKIKHNVESSDGEDSIVLEFVSDATLSINEMKVTPDTTVEQVKEFICSVYAHALRLMTSDIKLIYKGQLVHATDFAGNPAKMMSYINEPGRAKIHVHINQEFNEPGPGFWTELFSQSETSPDSEREAAEPVAHSMQPSLSVRSQTQSVHLSANPTPIPATGNRKYRYVTESGTPIEVTDERFAKCILGDEQILVPMNDLDPYKIQLLVGGQTISISSLDCIIENGFVKLSHSAISRLESKLQATIVKNSFAMQEVNVNYVDSNNDVMTQQGRGWNPVSYIRNSFPVVLLVFRTIYLLGNYSIIPLFFLSRLTPLVEKKYIVLISVIYVLRGIWSTREIWDMWSAYLNVNVINEETYVKIKNYISAGSLTPHFYQDCKNSPKVNDIFMASNLRESRTSLYQAYDTSGLDGDSTETLNVLFQRIHDQDLLKQPMDNFITSCLDLYDSTTRHTISSPYRESLNELLLIARKDLERNRPADELPWHRQVVRSVKNQYERVRALHLTTKITERIIPDPQHDSLPTAVIKNILLFFLILLPPVKTQVDLILQQRATRAGQHDQLADELPPVEPELIQELPANASGAQRHLDPPR